MLKGGVALPLEVCAKKVTFAEFSENSREAKLNNNFSANKKPSFKTLVSLGRPTVATLLMHITTFLNG